MSELVQRLVAVAFESATAANANEAIEGVRALRRAALGQSHSYELALPVLGAEEYLKDQVLPRLTYYLDCQHRSPGGAPHVFVSLFTPDGLFFIESADVVALLAQARGLSLEEVRRRYGENGSGDPRLLGA